MDKSKFITFAALLLVLAAALSFGIFWGTKQGIKQGKMTAEEKLEPIVQVVFPKPSAELRNINGVVRGIYGGMLDLEVNDPEDYLPHPDGSAPRKITKFVYISSNTEFFLVDPSKLDSRGAPLKSPLKFSDLKVGNSVSITSNQNIRNEQKFDATKVELVKY